MSDKTKFDLWVEYEKIAMHFNGLLIQLRLRALAGISLIASLAGIFADNQNGSLNWSLIAFVLVVLFLVWVAIFVIDQFYYDRLLTGAVRELLELEKNAKVEDFPIKMSTKIEIAAIKNRTSSPWIVAVLWFYGIIALLLLSMFLFAVIKSGWRPPCF